MQRWKWVWLGLACMSAGCGRGMEQVSTAPPPVPAPAPAPAPAPPPVPVPVPAATENPIPSENALPGDSSCAAGTGVVRAVEMSLDRVSALAGDAVQAKVSADAPHAATWALYRLGWDRGGGGGQGAVGDAPPLSP